MRGAALRSAQAGRAVPGQSAAQRTPRGTLRGGADSAGERARQRGSPPRGVPRRRVRAPELAASVQPVPGRGVTRLRAELGRRLALVVGEAGHAASCAAWAPYLGGRRVAWPPGVPARLAVAAHDPGPGIFVGSQDLRLCARPRLYRRATTFRALGPVELGHCLYPLYLFHRYPPHPLGVERLENPRHRLQLLSFLADFPSFPHGARWEGRKSSPEAAST